VEQWFNTIVQIMPYASVFVLIAFVFASFFYTTFDHRFISKQRSGMYVAFQLIGIYFMLLLVTFFYINIISYAGLDMERLKTDFLIVSLIGFSAVLLAAWAVRLLTRRTLGRIWSVLYSVTIFPAFIVLVYNLADRLERGEAYPVEYFINLPILFAAIAIFVVPPRHPPQDIRSHGLVSAEELRERKLILLYTIDKHQQVLKDEDDGNIRYLYDMERNQYYKYEIVPRKKVKTGRKRRKTSYVPADALVAAAKEDEAGPTEQANDRRENTEKPNLNLPPRSSRRR
jgi:hypothetical protein